MTIAETQKVGTNKHALTAKNNQKVSVNKSKPNTIFTYKDILKDLEGDVKKRALQTFKNDLKSGKLQYKKWDLRLDDTTTFVGKDRYIYTPDKKETFGDLKNRYNLPDGFFKDTYANGLPGNKDLDEILGPISFKKDELEKQLGVK